MKKRAIFLVLAVLLSGCGEKNKELEQGLALRARALQGSTRTFSAQIVADYGDTLYEFSMDCQVDSQGHLSFQVTAPETISGITGALSEDGGVLTFDDTALAFPMLVEGLASPISGPWLFWKALTAGYITSAGQDGSLLRLSIDDNYEENAFHLDIWCNEENIPVRVEICQENRNILTISVSNFAIV